MEPSESVLRRLFAATVDALVVVDAAGTVVFVNDQVERFFGWPPDELVGRPVEVLVPARLREQHRRDRTAYLADPHSRMMGAGLCLDGCRRDGSEFPIELTLSAMPPDEDGRHLVLASVRDVTDRLELEMHRQQQALETEQEQLRRLEGLGQLAGGVAHDFNNLLGVILNYTELIGRVVEDRSVHEDLGQIRTAAERGAALTRQLLSFARQDVVRAVPVDVNDVVRGMGTRLERTMGDQIEVHVTLADSPLIAEADRNQLEQIIVNLALNARDAMPDGGELKVTLDHTEAGDDGDMGDVTIRVTDTGSGMAPDVVARAFEPFFTTKDRARGSGLGLASVYGIARRSGGDVLIDSQVGTGTTITVRLPGSALTPAADAAGVLLAVGGGERVLLVEDEDALRVATARVLESHGYEVLTADDGVAALELMGLVEARGDTIGVIVTDVVMPRMRGDELADRVAERWPTLPIVFVSGHDAGVVAQSGRRLLDKPVDKEILLRALREALDG